MKRILLITTILILLCSSQVLAATYYVSQNNAGSTAHGTNGTSYADRASVSYHNAGSGVFATLDGDTVYLCDTITSRIIVPDSGSSGNVITYRGDYAGHASDLNIADGGSGQISYTQKDYITFQSLTLRNGAYGITSVGGSDHIIIKKCTIHDNTYKAIHFHGTYGENSYITIGGASGDGNTIYNISTNTAGTDVMLSHVNNFIVSHNTLYGIASEGVDGIATEYASYGVIEYNTIYDHVREDGIDFKENSHHIIVRFNNIYGHPNQSGITVQRGSYNIYIYGNQIYDTSYGAIYIKRGNWSGHNVQNIYIWSNLLYDNDMVGVAVSSSGTSSSSISNVRIYNNVIASSGTSPQSYLNTGIDIRYGSGHIVKNNIFFGNTGSSGREYAQMYVGSGYTSAVTFQYNRGYYSGQTAKVYWGASGLINFNSATAGSNNSTGDPGFTNEPGNDYTLLGTSACKDTGVDLSGLVGSVSIQGTTYHMYWDDCLDDSYVDFSTNPPTVRMIKQDDYGSWEKGAYIYTSGSGVNQPPDGSIDTPASNVTVDENDSVSLAGSYTDPEGDTCTYAWDIPTNTFKVWDGGTTYALNDLVEDDGVAGAYYKSKQASNTNHNPPDATWWYDAETQATPGTGVCDAAGVYNVGLTVSDDAPLADPTPASVTITVNTGGVGQTTKVWTHSTGYDYNTDAITYINQDSGTCTQIEAIAGDSYEYNVGRYSSNYRGSEIVKTGGYPAGCRIKLQLRRIGTLTGRTFHIYEIPLSGSNLNLASQELIASMSASDISTSWTVYTFNCSHNLTEGNMLIVTVDGAVSSNNYVEFKVDTDSEANLGDQKWYYNTTGNYGGSGNYDFYIEIWETSGSLDDTNYGTATSVYAKKISVGDDDNKKIAYSVNLSDIAGESVTDAKLELYLTTAPTANINVEVWSCADSIVEGEATWNIYSTGNSWTGTHGQTTFLNETAFTSSSSTGQYYTWQSNDFTSYIAGKAGSTAYLILYSDTNDTSDIVFTSDDGTDAQRPKLTVTYGTAASVPEIVNTTCSTADGSYKDGDSIGTFQVTFSEPVDVTGTPTLKLETGANDVTVNYSFGTGTATLTFAAFTVAAASNHTTSDLDGIELDRNSGTILSSDDATSVAVTGEILDVFPTGATIGALAYNKAIVIDTTAPTAATVNNSDSHATANGTYATAGTEIKFAIVFDVTGLIVSAEPGYPRIEMSVHPDETIYAYAMGLGDTTGTIITGFPLTIGMRSTDLNFTGDLDLGPGGTITDAAGNDISTSMGALSLAAVAAIVVAVPYPTTDQKEFTDAADYTAWIAGGGYGVPNDFFRWTEDADTDGFNASTGDGTSGNEITYNGQGFTILGNQTFGDYSIIKRMVN